MDRNLVKVNRRDGSGGYGNAGVAGGNAFGYGGYYRGVAANDNHLLKHRNLIISTTGIFLVAICFSLALLVLFFL